MIPAWVAVAAILASTAASVYATERGKAGQAGFAPAPGEGGQTKQPFAVPNVYGNTGTSFLGNSPRLSQALESQGGAQTTPNYGPQPGSSPYEQYAMQEKIRGMGKGK